jgi:23S rRNA pseudouridine1911/1915/1917 synthase
LTDAIPDLEVLYTDSHLLAVNKPAGVPVQPDLTGDPALLDIAKAWLKKEYNKPGNVYLGLLHRLDRPVAGVVLFARTSKAAARLSKQFRERIPKKMYRVVVHGCPNPENGELTHYLRKEKTRKATVFTRETEGAKQADLRYEVLERLENASILEVTLQTGRFHQIRAQLAFVGHPVLGDKKYGAAKALPQKQIALYASSLTVRHPINKKEMVFTSPPPEGWPFADPN